MSAMSGRYQSSQGAVDKLQDCILELVLEVVLEVVLDGEWKGRGAGPKAGCLELEPGTWLEVAASDFCHVWQLSEHDDTIVDHIFDSLDDFIDDFIYDYHDDSLDDSIYDSIDYSMMNILIILIISWMILMVN